MPQPEADEPAVRSVAPSRIKCFGIGGVFRHQQMAAQQRRHGDCQDPAQQQRDGNDLEQRPQKVPRGVVRQSNRRKCQDADHGGTEQRKLGALH